jgi:hypothetical protein
MTTIDEIKRKLCEAEEMLRVARSETERQRWTAIVQTYREAIKGARRVDG